MVGLTVLVPAAAYAWWSPDVSWYRTIVPTAAALYLALQLRKARAQRP